MKKHIPLIIGLALPFIFLIVIAGVIYVPNLSIKPQHDFLYSSEDRYNYNYSYRNTYEIKNSRLVLRPLELPPPSEYNNRVLEEAPTLYRYDVDTNSIHEIELSEAQILSLDPGPTSPDGYNVTYNYSHDGLFELFGSNNNDSGYFITKGRGAKKLPGLAGSSYRYDYNFKFIGWVK